MAVVGAPLRHQAQELLLFTFRVLLIEKAVVGNVPMAIIFGFDGDR